MLEIGKKMMSEAKFFMGYSRWVEEEQKYETWDESVKRVMDMHRQKYADKMTPALAEAIDFAEEAYKDQLVLGAQRALQFGGEQIFKHEARMYNCSSSYVDRPRFFSEAFYLLLSGCGVGFSVQRHHIDKLPMIARRSQKKAKVFQIPDSIEGWADAIGVLLSSYFTEGGQFPEYKGCQVHFDFSKIRPRGAYISGGFKAPGPDGLRKTLIKCEELLENFLKDGPILKMNSITAYDLVMHISDAVLSGGVRRCLPGETLVKIGPDEWKPIQDLSVDDRVYIFGEYETIENKFEQGEQELVKIELEYGFLESTPNHRWFVFDDKTKEMYWCMAKDLQPHHAIMDPEDGDISVRV